MKKLFTFLSLSVIYTGIFAQEQNSYQWQWAQTGGSAEYVMWNESLTSLWGTVAPNGETVNDITVDKHNNIYFSTHLANNAQFMGHTIAGHNYIIPAGYSASYDRSHSDILIASVDCEGKYRWHYTIGGHDNDVVTNIETDTLGGVYVSIMAGGWGPMFVDSIWFNNDTAFLQGNTPTLANGGSAIVKLDTLGNLQWVNWSSGATDGATIKMYPQGLQVEPNGTAHWAMQVYEPGVYADGQMTITASDLQKGSNTVVMKYDRNGNFLGYVKLPIFNAGYYYTLQSGVFNHINDFRADFINKRYFLCGYQGGVSEPAIYIADDSIPPHIPNESLWRGYVATFNFNGNHLWHYKNTAFICPMDFDKDGNLYVSAITWYFGDVIYDNNSDYYHNNNLILKILPTGEVDNEYRKITVDDNISIHKIKYNLNF